MERNIEFNEPLLDIAAKETKSIPTPFMLTDLDCIRARCIDFKKYLPEVALVYAVKAYCTDKIINTIRDIVDGFDVASPGEIEFLLRNDVSADRIFFSNPVKSEEHIRQAFAVGIKKFAFQSLSELKKISKVAPGSKVYLRLDVGYSNSYVPLSDKFGCSEAEATGLLSSAQAIGLEVEGITFHVGSQLLDVNAWDIAIEKANFIASELKKLGIGIKFISIGGGFAARYYASDPTLESSTQHIRKAIDKNKDVKYHAEPGRYIVADSSMLVTTVIGVEKRKGHLWAYIDAGKFQAFLGADRYSTFPYLPFVVKPNGDIQTSCRTVPVTITGPTCDSQDIIVKHIELPVEITAGDRLIFPNMGAYTLVYGSQFNGFEVPKICYLMRGQLL